MAFGNIPFKGEYFYFSSYDAVGDMFTAVDIGSFHDDAVLDFSILKDNIISYTRIWSDVWIGA